MSSDTLQSAIASIRAGDKETGKLLLAEVIRNDPRNETAGLWMSAVIDTHEQRRFCLERILAINTRMHDRFTVVRPVKEQEAALIDVLLAAGIGWGRFGGKKNTMKWLRVTVAYIKALFSTLKCARYMSAERRRKISHQILQLAELRGWDVLASKRYEYSLASVSEAPVIGGVYRVYDGDEVVYIGAAWRVGGLHARLKDHLKTNESNRDLAEFLASGEASVEWYACQAPGWMEDYELTEFREGYGRLPRFNRIQAGACVRGWWY